MAGRVVFCCGEALLGMVCYSQGEFPQPLMSHLVLDTIPTVSVEELLHDLH